MVAVIAVSFEASDRFMSRTPPLMPNEDYEAIEAAVMDTARGRWFLAEFARRNRTADTRILLDAIARLEEMLAARPESPALPKPHAPITDMTIPSSADSELFAMPVPEPQSVTRQLDVAAPAPAPGAYDPPVEIVEIDVEHLILPTPVAPRRTVLEPAVSEVPASMPAAPEPEAAPAPPPAPEARRSPLAAALAQLKQSAGQGTPQTSGAETVRTGYGVTPPVASPVELDALSFEEKSVYFA